HTKSSVEHGVTFAFPEPADECRPEQRAVPGRVPIVENDALSTNPAIEPRRIPRPAVDHRLESRTRVRGRAAAGEGGGPHRSSPRSTVTACPPRITRSPASRTRTTPPRADAW